MEPRRRVYNRTFPVRPLPHVLIAVLLLRGGALAAPANAAGLSHWVDDVWTQDQGLPEHGLQHRAHRGWLPLDRNV
jgi:hypothetical protein